MRITSMDAWRRRSLSVFKAKLALSASCSDKNFNARLFLPALLSASLLAPSVSAASYDYLYDTRIVGTAHTPGEISNGTCNDESKLSGRDTVVLNEIEVADKLKVNELSSLYHGSIHNRVSSKATGYFRTHKGDNGRWWLLDPTGRIFYSLGVNSIRRKPTVSGDPAFKRKWGGSESFWARSVTSQLLSYGFNTSGSWSHDHTNPNGILTQGGLNGESQLARTPQLHLLKKFRGLPSRKTQLDDMAKSVNNSAYRQSDDNKVEWSDLLLALVVGSDGDSFRRYAERKTQEILATSSSDPHVLGYFTDNELILTYDLLDVFLRLDDQYEAKKFAEDWLRANITDSNQRWGVRQNLLYHRTGGPNTNRVRRDFLKEVTANYFKIVDKALAQAAPNHMVLGSRFHRHGGILSSPNDGSLLGKKTIDGSEIFEAASPYVDIVSINYYHAWSPDQALMDNWLAYAKKPFMITEFYTKSTRAKLSDGTPMRNCSGAGWIVKWQSDRGRFYQNFGLGVLRHPGSVGLHWFTYKDADPKESDDASNKGIVNAEFETYLPLRSAMRLFNQHVYSLRWRAAMMCRESPDSPYCQ